MSVVRISPNTLRQWLSEPVPPIVIDVRDEDYIGGHIRGARNIPSCGFECKVDDLVAELAGAPRVVFHCQLSQQRGPTCAKKFLVRSTSQTKVYILNGGFNAWAQEYGSNDELTEDFQAYLYV